MTTKFLHITDPHFNFLGTYIPPEYVDIDRKVFASPYDFGTHLKKTFPDCDGAIISGDIAEAPSLKKCLRGFAKGFEKETYFICGNHDYYHGSWASVHTTCGEIAANEKIHWLRKSGVIELSPTLAICGNEGWYDARAGLDPLQRINVDMSDFYLIKDLKNMCDFDRIMKLRETARHWTAEAAIHLREACEKYPNVIFVTHVPPFPAASWHEGKISNGNWLPWMCNVTMGDMLIEVSYEYPDTQILTLCGHTHSPGDIKVAPNLRILTGESRYWNPRVSKVLTYNESGLQSIA